MHWNPAIGIPLLIIGCIVLALIWLFGQPRKPGQGRRQPSPSPGSGRREPTLGESLEESRKREATDSAAPVIPVEPFQTSLLGSEDVGSAVVTPIAPDTLSGPVTAFESPQQQPELAPVSAPLRSNLGWRPTEWPVERIVAINVVALEYAPFQGADLVVAADKAGLDFGHKGIFHRLLEGKSEQGPVFSVANMLQPGSFDLGQVVDLSTTGLSFFMTLPGPSSALDAWDAMLPTAQRMAELLGGQVLDDEHNALGRQRIAHIRDELRAWDRKHQGDAVGFDS